jgi:hypothetical protein
MSLRFFLSLLVLVMVSPAMAQEACTPHDTPDIGAEQAAPTLFSHCIEDGKCGAVDKTGAWRIKPEFRDVLIKDDFIVVPENEDWTRYGFLDADGKRLGGGDYGVSVEEDLPVSEGMLPVTVGEKTGYVDRTGTLVVPAELGYGWAFEDGIAAAEKDGKHGYIDKTGNFVITVADDYDDLSAFVGDVAVVGKEGKYGLIDKTGKTLIAPKFDSLYSDGDILVALEGAAYGLIDHKGNWIAKADFAAIGPYSKGLAPAMQGELWGFIDTCGNWKIPAKYQAAVGFDGGPARVKLDEKWGLIDAAGTEIYAPGATYIGEGVWKDGLITFSPDDTKYGLLDAAGRVAVEAKYDSIDPLGGGVLQAYVGEEMKLLNLDGSEIVIPKP